MDGELLGYQMVLGLRVKTRREKEKACQVTGQVLGVRCQVWVQGFNCNERPRLSPDVPHYQCFRQCPEGNTAKKDVRK
jgi:hypothetical protein